MNQYLYLFTVKYSIHKENDDKMFYKKLSTLIFYIYKDNVIFLIIQSLEIF